MKKKGDIKNPKDLPKIIALTRNGLYDIMTEVELKNDPDSYEKYYGVLIYIGDENKGPHYVFKFSQGLVFDHKDLKYSFHLSPSFEETIYSDFRGVYDYDMKDGDKFVFSDAISIKSIRDAYSIQPFILQSFSIMTWLELQYNEPAMFGLPFIDIYMLGYQKNDQIELNLYDVYPTNGGMEYKKKFQDLYLSTDTMDMFYQSLKQFIFFFDDGRYVFHENRTRESDQEFLLKNIKKRQIKYVGFPILSFCAMIILTPNQINRLNDIGSINVYFVSGYASCDTHIKDIEYEELDGYPSFYTVGDLTDILELIVYTTNTIQNMNLFLQYVNGFSDLEIAIVLTIRGIPQDVRIDVSHEELKYFNFWELINRF